MTTRAEPRSSPTLNSRFSATNLLSCKCCASNRLPLRPRASFRDTTKSMEDRVNSTSSSCSTTLQVNAPFSSQYIPKEEDWFASFPSSLDNSVQKFASSSTLSDTKPTTLTLQSNLIIPDNSNNALEPSNQETCSYTPEGKPIQSSEQGPLIRDQSHANHNDQKNFTNPPNSSIQISPKQLQQQIQEQSTNFQSQATAKLSVSSFLKPPSTPLPISHLVSPVEIPSNVHPIEPSELASILFSTRLPSGTSCSSMLSASLLHTNRFSNNVSRNQHLPTVGKLQRSSSSPAPLILGKSSVSLDAANQSHVFSRKTLLVDTRLVTLYALGCISNAISVCIPTTLLKRPNFGLHKFGTCLSAEKQATFKNISDYEYIVLYDQNSTDLSTSNYSALLYTSLKFARSPDVPGKVVFLRGGFEEFAQRYPMLIDTREDFKGHESFNRGHTSSSSNTQRVVSASGLESSDHPNLTKSYMEEGISTPLVLSNFSIPVTATKKGPIPAFFSNIRSAMEQQDDVEFPVSLPPDLTEAEVQTGFSPWLRVVIDRKTGPKQVTRNFNSIESSEKSRLLDAFSDERMRLDVDDNMHRQADDASSVDKVVISGVELGSKNRYNNIWPYAHSRVRLNRNRGGVTDDYINANFIENSSSSHRYIATQGPLPSTFNDFWQMVWNQDVPVIVMLTAESEGGQIKCDKYWRQGWHGDIQVSTASKGEMPLSNANRTKITVRKFLLRHRDSDLEKTVSHIQYGSWPDFGASASPRDLLALCELKNRLAKEIFLADKNSANVFECMPPTIVHCSAGCGRTGTFCVVDTIIDLLRNQRWAREVEEDLIYRTVENFRKQRLSMVQSIRQYALCYEAVILWQHLFNRREIA